MSDLVNGVCVWSAMLSGHRQRIEKARILWSVFRVMRKRGTPEANVLTHVAGEGRKRDSPQWISMNWVNKKQNCERSDWNKQPKWYPGCCLLSFGTGDEEEDPGPCQRGTHTSPVLAATLEPFLEMSMSLSRVRDAQLQYVFPNYLPCAKLCSSFYVPLTTFLSILLLTPFPP